MELKTVRFSSTRTWGLNKVGNLKRDKDGYVKVVIGALDCFNSAGMFYDYQASKEMFSESSALQRRIQNKALSGELGHPRMVPGMSDNEYRARLLDILETNIVCHWRSIELVPNQYKDPEGRPVIAIIGETIPAGPQAEVFERKLNNKDENICFSIRSFTHDWIEGGIVKRKIVRISTFDMVNEPGISIATKFNAPSLESIDDKPMSRGDFVMLEREITKNAKYGNESAAQIITEIARPTMDFMGWKVGKSSNTENPPWKGW